MDIQKQTARLLVLIRVLIDYGTRMAELMREGDALEPTDVVLRFGTLDFKRILARITHGLRLAAGLEATLQDRAARPPAQPAAFRAMPHAPRQPARPTGRNDGTQSSRLARMPTAAHIAEELRRRPIGAVLADIGRDLGIVPSDPIWRELTRAIIENEGDIASLLRDTEARLAGGQRQCFALQHPPEVSDASVGEICLGTGPP